MEKTEILTIHLDSGTAEEYRREIIHALVTALKSPFSKEKPDFDAEETTRYWFLLDLLGRLLEECPALDEKSAVQVQTG